MSSAASVRLKAVRSRCHITPCFGDAPHSCRGADAFGAAQMEVPELAVPFPTRRFARPRLAALAVLK